MCAELAGGGWHAALGKVPRAPADDAADRPHPGRNQAAVGQFANPHGEIDIIFQKVCHAVGQHDPDVDLPIGCQELNHDREDVHPAEYDRRRDDQLASGGAVFA